MLAAEYSSPDKGSPSWHLAGGFVLNLNRPAVMGILNITPDSFSDGGSFFDCRRAIEHAYKMAEEGASIIDIGGASSRPGTVQVDEEEEIRRVIPVIKALSDSGMILSIDTCRAATARAALDEGVNIINDISGLMADDKMAGTAASYRAGIVLMHMRGNPSNMQTFTAYNDVAEDLINELHLSIKKASDAGIKAEAIAVDPGIGFSKTPEQNLEILKNIHKFKGLGKPIMVGPSRKSFIGAICGAPVEKRLPGTLAAVIASVSGGAKIIRVHDVAETIQAIAVTEAIQNI